jgi:hypothetical protein
MTPAPQRPPLASTTEAAEGTGELVKVRLWGTPAACQATARQLGQVLEVVKASPARPDRSPDSSLVRIYLHVRPGPTH